MSLISFCHTQKESAPEDSQISKERERWQEEELAAATLGEQDLSKGRYISA